MLVLNLVLLLMPQCANKLLISSTAISQFVDPVAFDRIMRHFINPFGCSKVQLDMGLNTL